MKHSLQVSRCIALSSVLLGVPVVAVNPARAEEPTDSSEKVELASIDEEVTAPVPTGGGTSQPAYPVAPDSSNAPATGQGGRREPRLGGHVGVATPFVTVSKQTTTIGDQFTLLHPIGISVKFEKVTVDFETVVVNPISPSGRVGLVIDPGVVYNFGPVAAGLRLAWQQADSNFGLIPLVNKGIVDIGEATWFVEAAFPTFYSDSSVQFNMVLHSGIGF
jgi:hypothetical protein